MECRCHVWAERLVEQIVASQHDDPVGSTNPFDTPSKISDRSVSLLVRDNAVGYQLHRRVGRDVLLPVVPLIAVAVINHHNNTIETWHLRESGEKM